jgi:DNA adenine methylase
MRAPHPIPYQGSKRFLAPSILRYFPKDTNRLFEPFAGAAAVSIAAALHRKAHNFIMADINGPLMDLWEQIINSPEAIVSAYRRLWEGQQGKEREYYDSIRERFNKTKRADYLLYLLLRCVKASVRYNSEGQFNQSPDNRRQGMKPETLRHHILTASELLRGKTEVRSLDYRESLASSTVDDLVYMDPPYQGVCGSRDQRYFGAFDTESFKEALAQLNTRKISYILSYDGRTGERVYGKPMPKSLGLTRMEIDAGRSSQATLLGESSITVESIYLSPSLTRRLGGALESRLTARPIQLTLVDWPSKTYRQNSSSD